VLIAKWAAIEAAARAPLVMVLIAAGSAFTVVFWTKWMGRLVSRPPSTEALPQEQMSPLFGVPLVGLALGAVILTALVVPIMDLLIEPAVALMYAGKGLDGFGGELASNVGSFPVWPLLIVMAALLIVAYFASQGRPQQVQSAYLCGENLAELSSAEFRGAVDQAQAVRLRSYYFEGWLGESKVTRLANPIALALLVALLGVAFL
jgi:ech hydrogenase subunit A